MTTYLKFPDEATAMQVLSAYRNEDQWLQASHNHALDIIGTIYKPTGVKIQTELGEVDQTAPVDGYHVNFIGNLPLEAEQYIVIPTNPVRIFYNG